MIDLPIIEWSDIVSGTFDGTGLEEIHRDNEWIYVFDTVATKYYKVRNHLMQSSEVTIVSAERPLDEFDCSDDEACDCNHCVSYRAVTERQAHYCDGCGHAKGLCSCKKPGPSLPADEALIHDQVHHPAHYTWLPSKIEVIDVVEHLNFNLGNAIKYILRAGKKGTGAGDARLDLEKARWYVDREIQRILRYETNGE